MSYIDRAKSVEWETPQELYDRLDSIYHFNTDVCATPDNAKCPVYWTKADDGLAQDWTGHVCWCNPPYGKQIADWVKKAATSCSTTVMLLPARTDAGWFHDYCLPYGKITFLRGRLRYGGSQYNAPFPSMLVEFRRTGLLEEMMD